MTTVYNPSERDLLLEDGADCQHQGGCVILEFGDLGIEENRIALIEAMILDRVIPGTDGEAERLKSAIVKLPRRTVDEIVTTAAKLNKTCCQRTALLLEGFERLYVAQSRFEARNFSLQR